MTNISYNKSKHIEILYHESDSLLLNIVSIVDLIIIILGTLGNLTSFYLLSRKRIRTVSSMRFLSVLTLIDCLCLYGWYMSSVYRQLNDESHLKRLENISALTCKLISFFSFVTLQFSSFLLCMITIDRLLIMNSSYWRSKFTNLQFANKVIIFSIIFFVIFNIPIPIRLGNKGLVYYKIKKYSRETDIVDYYEYNDNQVLNAKSYETITLSMWHCYDDNDKLLKVWNIIHLCLYSLIPFPILCILNLIVIHMTRNAARQATQNNIEKFKTGQQFVTRLLLFLTLSFILTTLPSTIVYAFWHNQILSKKYGRLILNILNTIQFSRHSFNWIIYLYSSSFMRIELKKCLSCSSSDYEIAQMALAHRPSVAIEIMRQIEKNETKYNISEYDHLDLYYLYCLYEKERMGLIRENDENTFTGSIKNRQLPESIKCTEINNL